MTDTHPAALQALLQEWFTERQQALREQLLQAFSGQEHWTPDPAFLERVLATAAPRDTDAELGLGLDRVGAADTQGEVLKRLLEVVQPFSERSALFIIKQGIASLYAQRGFESQPKLGAPVVPPPELDELIQGDAPYLQTAGPAYLALLEPLALRPAPAARIVPLHLRRKTVALLLVDSGTRDALPCPSHIRALALGAEARLAFLARSKDEERAAQPDGDTRPARITHVLPVVSHPSDAKLHPVQAPVPAVEAPRRSFETPHQAFEAPHQFEAPRLAFEAPHPFEAPRQAFEASHKAFEAPHQAFEAPPHAAQTLPLSEIILPPCAGGLEPAVRTNAERSARVLVGDLELYFPAKVSLGQSLGNLYGSMKDELERSRASFVERYGEELEGQHQIFYKTVVQQLCAGDPSRLGPAPWTAR